MNVVFSTPDGPLEGFTEAEFRVAINDDGVGRLVGPPEVISSITGPITCSVAGFPVFRWSPEESNENYGDDDSFTINGRGRTGALDRAIVLPVGYPNYTERTRTEQGSPFGIWAALLAEAQGRNRVLDITPSWTATHDTNGEPWKETVDIQLEPGTTLRSLLSNVTEVEGAEWFLQPNGELDAATTLGEDLSGEVVLFVSRQQVSRNRRLSKRDQRQTVYIEASTGVSEAVNSLSEDAGEIWLEAQDYADSLSRQAIADKLADKYDNPQEEVDINVSPDCGIFDTFTVGDRIGLDTGSGTIQTVRVVGALITVTDTIEVELTLISEVALRQQKIDRAIEAKADVQLAATPAIQRRHGLVTADKFLSGAVGDAVAISSENYVPGQDGWAILGNGNAEFNDATFRGDLQSDNYVPNVSGWFLDRNGFAEFEEGLFRGDIVGSDIVGSTFATAAADAGVHRILVQQVGSQGQILFLDPSGTEVGRLAGLAQSGFNRVDLTTAGNLRIVSAGTTAISTPNWQIESNGVSIFGSTTAGFIRSNGGLRVVGQIDAEASVLVDGNVTAGGSGSFGGLGFFGGQLSVNGNTALNANVTIGGDTEFRITTSGRSFRMNQAGSGSLGGEPTLDTTGDLFGFSGTSARRLFRSFAGAFLTSSEGRLKGEMVDADLADCYKKVRDMRLTRYSLHRDRDAYYIAKGDAILAGDDFDDPGGPLPKLGIVAEHAPDEVADEEHRNIDVYAYASLIAGAVKKLQEKVEILEEAIDGG